MCAQAHDVFHEHIHEEYYIDTQNPLALDKVNILQPNVAIYSRADFLQLTQHPTAAMVRLLIEVADTTYLQDKPRYAQAGILHVWIVNLKEKTVEVFQSPRNSVSFYHPLSYRSVCSHPIWICTGNQPLFTLRTWLMNPVKREL